MWRDLPSSGEIRDVAVRALIGSGGRSTRLARAWQKKTKSASVVAASFSTWIRDVRMRRHRPLDANESCSSPQAFQHDTFSKIKKRHNRLSSGRLSQLNQTRSTSDGAERAAAGTLPQLG